MSLKNHLILSLSAIILFLNVAANAAAESLNGASSAAIEATATVVNPVGLIDATADVPAAFFDQSRSVEPGSLTANTGERYRLFYCPRGGKALLQIEADGSLVKQVHLKGPESGPSELLITSASIPNVSLVSMAALARTLPPDARSLQVTIIYSEN